MFYFAFFYFAFFCCDFIINISFITIFNIFLDNKANEASITIIFSNDYKLRKLKKEYFGENVFTDTISFNLEEDGDPIDGEIYISLNRVSENAREFNQDTSRELKRVIIHGCLHLLGYDDQTSEGKKTMTHMEDHYLSQPIVSGQI